ncbi:MAG: hypothetical protein ACRDSR_23885 [Pseudonocardiaceae bacterium]
MTTPTNTPTARTAAMAAGRRADTGRRRQRVLKALNDAAAAGHEISVSGIARTAGVDRTFLYRHRDLLTQLHALEAQPANAPGVGPTVSRASLQTDLLAAQERASRLAGRVQQLERRLSEALGHQAWRESGLGAPDDIDRLKQQIVMLEQQTVDLRLQLEERDQELHTARATNREFMTRLNTPTPQR